MEIGRLYIIIIFILFIISLALVIYLIWHRKRVRKDESPTDGSVGFILGNAGICSPFSSATKRWRSPKGIPADGGIVRVYGDYAGNMAFKNDYATKRFKCPDCYKEVGQEDVSCPFCGVDFLNNKFLCPTCESSVSPAQIQCLECGEILEADPFVCPNCSRILSPRARHCPFCDESFWSPIKERLE